MLRVYKFSALFLLVVLLQMANSRRNIVSMRKLASCREFVSNAFDCEHHFPIDYMKNYRDGKYGVHLKLYVFSYHDANIVLSSPKPHIDCRIIIGGYSNTLSVLKCNGTDVDKSHLKNITSPMWPIPIVIRHTGCGWLDVSIPGVAEPLLTANVPDLHVNSICLYAHGQENRWFYNCSEEEDEQYDFESNNCTIYSEARHVEQKEVPCARKTTNYGLVELN